MNTALMSNKKFDKLYISKNFEYLSRFASYLNSTYIFIKIAPDTFLKMSNVCQEEGTLCILREYELSYIGKEKDDVKERVNYANGLAAYFFVYK